MSRGLERFAPTAEQEAAIAARDADVFLEAGAGTGKTSVLVERFCDAVIVDGTAVDGILAFTFTERAAAQLKRKIREALQERAEGEPDAERRAELEDAAAAAGSAWISTIHGFCRRLLATHPMAAGIDPRFAVIDDAEAERLAARAFDAALEAALADGDPGRARIAGAVGIQGLRAIVRAAHDELRSMGREPVLPDRLPAPDPHEALGAMADAARAALAEVGGDGNARHVEMMQQAVAVGELTGELPGSAAIKDLCFSKTVKAAQGPAGAAYREAVVVAADALASVEAAEDYALIRDLLSDFAARYADLKRRRSGLDFEDLQIEAVRLLQDHPNIAAIYQDRFDHVMVDEFQDTNRLQLALIDLLRTGAHLFTVGDWLQSIYAFRHADVRVFEEQREKFDQDPGGSVLGLRGNFRSEPRVLEAINSVGAALFSGFVPLAPEVESSDDEGPLAEILVTETEGWKPENGGAPGLEFDLDDDAPHWRVAEARFLARRLKALSEEGFPRADMVVLLRAFTSVGVYEDAMARAGLNPYVVGGRGYWAQQQVEDARRLLGCVANPLDDECLFASLTVPGGVKPDTLWMLRRFAADRHVWPELGRLLAGEEPPEGGERVELPAAEEQLLREFKQRLETVRAEAPLVSLESLIERAITVFDYDVAVLAMGRGRARMANLRKLMRLARDFESREGRDLRGFLEFLETRSAAGQREGEAATEVEGHDGVRLMTVHAAKGLQFPLVAVADLGRSLSAGWPGRIQLGEADGGGPEDQGIRVGLQLARLGASGIRAGEYTRLADEAALAESEEGRRLGYVAVTRAQRRLILSGSDRLSKVAELRGNGVKPVDLGNPDSIIRRILLADTGLPVTENAPSPEAIGQLNERLDSGPADAEDSEPGRPPLARPAAPVDPPVGSLSYSSIDRYAQCGYRFYAERVLRLPQADQRAGNPGALEFGNAVHELLRWSAVSGWAMPDPDHLLATLRRNGLDGEENAERAGALIEGWLDSELRGSLPETVHPEVPFLLDVNGRLVRGFIDLLAELPGEGLLVVDYKTNRLGGSAPEMLGASYETQRGIYALAASSQGGMPVRTAYVFLERPDTPVIFDFAEQELADARAALEASIARIEAGEYPVTDNPRWDLCGSCPARRHLCSYTPEQIADAPPAELEPAA
jgi:ATP-dependent exoDNAse (exonuclease V) beta subunit